MYYNKDKKNGSGRSLKWKFLTHLNTSAFYFFHEPVVLEAPDTVLVERAAGKRIDTKTGGEWPV